ncbi:TsaC protein (YrdC domain) required for threonylcarbamoyladenosine t(6)A37 modification in tRNA [hydrothermal vent metagenome]|uniref:L-threonylcarbamoyladenylate synthase n=1 Tax=hydrothermal vent metagenome TaxID=652676 RepID=A0A1W1BYE9_9ZZZZ
MIRNKIAKYHLKNGGVIAHQTDTIIGLACLVNQTKAIKKIITIKKRSTKKGLILLGTELSQFKKYLLKDLNQQYLKKLQTEQNISWVCPANKKTTKLIRGDFDTIAIRITNNKNIKALVKNQPLVSTSANINGRKTATTILKLKIYFKNNLDFIILGKKQNNTVSKIKDILTNKEYR